MSAFVFQWAMIPDSVPVAHQRCEAIADLMDHLRDLGLVLTGEPRAAIQHGRDPILALTCDVRSCTVVREVDVMGRPVTSEAAKS